MALTTERLALLITADGKGAVRELDKIGRTADREMGRARSATDKWAGRLTAGGAVAVGFAALAGGALFKFAMASEEARHQQLILENTLANMPRLAGENKQSFIDLAEAIQDKTAADADAIVGAQGLLGTFRLTGDEIREITPLVVDYARKFGTDLQSAAIQVGKALDGNVGALKRNGVSIDEVLFKTDKYAAVQQALAEQVGGFAEAEGATFAGSLQRLRNELGDMAEGIGAGVVPVLQSLGDRVSGVTDAFNGLDKGTQAAVGTFATYATGAIGAVGATSLLAGQAIKLRTRFTSASGGLNLAGKAAVGLGGALAVAGIAMAGVEQQSARTADWTRRLSEALIEGGERAESVRIGLEGLGRAFGADEEFAQKFARTVEGELLKSLTSSETVTRDVAAAQREYADLLASGVATEAELAAARENVVTATKNQAVVQKDVTAATREGEEAAGGATDALDEERKASEKLREELQKLDDALFGSRDAQRDYAQALSDVELGWIEYRREQANAREDGVITREELLKLQGSLRGVQDDVDKVGEAGVTNFEKLAGRSATLREKTDILRTEYRKLADQFAPGSPMRIYIEQLIADLDRLTTDRTGTVTIDVQQRGFTVTPGGTQYRADGGPVHAGSPYVVGEKGPELFVPSRSGTIVPNGRTSMAGTINNYITMPPGSDGDDVVNAIERWRRRNAPRDWMNN